MYVFYVFHQTATYKAWWRTHLQTCMCKHGRCLIGRSSLSAALDWLIRTAFD